MKSNKKITITEKELYAVGQLAKQKDLSILPPEPELRKIHTFSERFERNMEEILASLDDSPRRSKGSRAVKYVLIAAAIIALIMALTMGAAALRERMYALQLTNNFDHAVGVFAAVEQGDGEYLDASSELTHLYAPANVPDGYEVAETSTNDISHTIIYINQTGSVLSFVQSTIDIMVYLDNEEKEFSKLTENDITYYYTFKNGYTTLYWTQNGYSFRLIGKIPYNTAIQIAQSLIAK